MLYFLTSYTEDGPPRDPADLRDVCNEVKESQHWVARDLPSIVLPHLGFGFVHCRKWQWQPVLSFLSHLLTVDYLLISLPYCIMLYLCHALFLLPRFAIVSCKGVAVATALHYARASASTRRQPAAFARG